MASIVTAPRMARARQAALLREPTSRAVAVVLAAVGVAWLIAVLAEVTGKAMAFHHHTLIEGGPPLWIALPMFLMAWQVMIVAMMLPASLPAIRAFDGGAVARGRPGMAMAGFLAPYAAVWTAYGVGAFLFDMGLHRLVDATPWLGARPWLIEATAVMLAGAYQFLPVKRGGLQACRHPAALQTGDRAPGSMAIATRMGFRHAIDCLTCSWALMLLMFAAGFANVWWMAALAGAMVYETVGRHGRRSSSMIGWGLFALAAVVIVTGWTPAFAGP